MKPTKRERKESKLSKEREREGSTQGKGGFYKNTTNSYSPSKAAKERRNIPLTQLV